MFSVNLVYQFPYALRYHYPSGNCTHSKVANFIHPSNNIHVHVYVCRALHVQCYTPIYLLFSFLFLRTMLRLCATFVFTICCPQLCVKHCTCTYICIMYMYAIHTSKRLLYTCICLMFTCQFQYTCTLLDMYFYLQMHFEFGRHTCTYTVESCKW